MCELFALNASVPVDVKISLKMLAEHGGKTGPHGDGWGVAFLDGRDAMLFRGTSAASTAPWITCLASYPIESATIVAHIRHATQGRISLANTQPFQRELWGRVHVFAHNGDIPLTEDVTLRAGDRYQPIGETDSETMFCRFLDGLAQRVSPTDPSADQAVHDEFAHFCRTACKQGVANIVYASAGRILAYSDRRMQSSGHIEPPGLWMLQRRCSPPFQHEFGTDAVSVAGTALEVTLVASVPLTNEPWRPLDRGTILDLAGGSIRMMTAD